MPQGAPQRQTPSPAGRRASTRRARSPPRHRRLAVPHGSPTGRRGPFPEESCRPPASRAKGSRVSALVCARRPRAGPRPAALTSSWHGPPRPQQIASGSRPAGCVIRQPELRRSALGCASVFSSNCSMARSARKIFQNKAVDGNCISTWGAEGMCAVGALLGTPLRQTDTHHHGGPGRARPGLCLEPLVPTWDTQELAWRASTAGPWGCPGLDFTFTSFGPPLSPHSPARDLLRDLGPASFSGWLGPPLGQHGARLGCSWLWGGRLSQRRVL